MKIVKLFTTATFSLFCLITSFRSALAEDLSVNYSGENLEVPLHVNFSVDKNSFKLIRAKQRSGDVILQLFDINNTTKQSRTIDFSTEYPYDEILLVSNSDCTQCKLKVSAKNKMDSVKPYAVEIIDLPRDDPNIPYLKSLSHTAELSYTAAQLGKESANTHLKDIIHSLQQTLKNFTLDPGDYRALVNTRLAETLFLVKANKKWEKQLGINLRELENEESIYRIFSLYEMGAIEPNLAKEANLYTSGMEISSRINDSLAWAIGANYLATSYIKKGNFEKAIQLLTRAEKIFREDGSIFWLSYPLNNLAWASYRSGKLSQALKYAAQQKFIAKNYDDFENELWSLFNLGRIYQRKGELSIALKFIDDALGRIDKQGTGIFYISLTELKPLLLNQKSTLLYKQGAYIEALDAARAFKEEVTAFNQPDKIADALFLEAEIQIKLGDLDLAENSLQQSIKLAKDRERKIFLAKCFRKMAEIKLLRKDTASALHQVTKAINLLNTTKDHLTLTRLLSFTLEALVKAGGLEESQALLADVAILIKKYGTGLDRIEFGHRKAMLLVRMGELAKAKNSLEVSLNEVELLLSTVKRKDHRRSYLALQKDLYEQLIAITLHLHPDHPAKGLKIAEQFKGLTLEEQLYRSRSHDTIDEALLEKRHQLHKQLLTVSKTGFSTDRDAFFRQARGLSSELEKLESLIQWGKSSIIKRAGLQELPAIPAGQIMLYYFAGKQASWCWVLSESNIDVIELRGETGLNKQIEPVVSTYAKPPAARTSSDWQDNKQLVELSDALLKDVFSILNARQINVNHFIIISDGALAKVPFAQLVSPATDDYLVADHAISYATSLESWQQLNKRINLAASLKKIILIASTGDYKFGELDLPALSNTQEEASIIKSLYKDKVQAITDFDNPVENLEQLLYQPTDILHFATHVSLNIEAPQLSFLLLPENNSQDRIWLSAQISTSKLSAKTVVLSSCETANGKLDAGEGMLSISRAFINAGATNVIGASRKIQDNVATILTRYFYQNIKSGDPTVRALQNAQNKIVDKHPEFSDPYFWAGYQLFGAG